MERESTPFVKWFFQRWLESETRQERLVQYQQKYGSIAESTNSDRAKLKEDKLKVDTQHSMLIRAVKNFVEVMQDVDQFEFTIGDDVSNCTGLEWKLELDIMTGHFTVTNRDYGKQYSTQQHRLRIFYDRVQVYDTNERPEVMRHKSLVSDDQ